MVILCTLTKHNADLYSTVSNEPFTIQDNFIRNHSLEAIKIHNPLANPRDPNDGESVAATLAVDLIEREVCD